MNHVGLINDSQVVILHKTLKFVYQKDFEFNKKYQPRQLKLLSYWSETVITYKVNIDPLICRGYLLAKTNAPVKFEGKGPMSWDIDQKAL
jgi:hypothetical protein